MNKIDLGEIERCYCSAALTADKKQFLVLAGEAEGGPCFAFSGPDFSQKEVVWQHGGGTMSLIQIPGRSGEFIAVQNFFPGFRSQTAKLVWGKRLPQGIWQVEDLAALPFVHRFDLFAVGDEVHILACVLCRSKREREDWSDPGFVAWAKLPPKPGGTVSFSPILEGLTKNHGYCRAPYQGRDAGYIACDQGIFALLPPARLTDAWESVPVLRRPVSDLALCDLDGDGQDELVTIEPFHGNDILVYHQKGGTYEQVWRHPGKTDFAHALAGCTLRGAPHVVCGARRGDADLTLLRCADPAEQRYEIEIIDPGVGPSNVTVVNTPERDLILAANHTTNRGAVYVVTE